MQLLTIYVLYLAGICVFVRSVVRLVEYIQEPTGVVAAHEAFIYVFDGALFWLVFPALAVLHPGRLFRKVRSIRSCNQTGTSSSGQTAASTATKTFA